MSSVESAHSAAFKRSEALADTHATTIQGYDFNNGVNYPHLMQSMSANGFQASNLGDAIKIVNEMLDWTLADEALTVDCSEEEKDHSYRASVRCKIFLGFTSNLVSSGVRENIRYLVEHHMVDVLATTAGGIEEDIIKCLAPTYKCHSALSGSQLRSKGLNRIGNLLVPNDNFCKFAGWIFPIFNQMLLEQRSEKVLWTPSRLIARLGKEINNESSYLYWAYKNNIPVFCPGITDGSLGIMLYFHSLCNPGLIVDVVQDIRAINDEAVRAGLRKTGMIILGGGLPKHHICNANLMRNGADYAIFINTGQEFDGSDSGARPDEAISWGKIKGGAKNVKVHCDATIAFPLLVAETFASRNAEVVHRKKKKNRKMDEKQKHVESAHGTAFKTSETLESTCGTIQKHLESAHISALQKSETLESRCATIRKQKRLESAYAATFKKSETLESTCATIQGYDFNHGVNYSQLIKSMSFEGFQASNLGDAIHIVNHMLDWRLADEAPTEDCIEEENHPSYRASVRCKVFLGFTSNLISSGVRENIRYLVEHHMVDVVVTTAGGIEEDLIKCLAPTYKGDFALPGAQLRSKGLNRIGNLLVPNDNYCEFEKWIIPIFDKMLTEQISEKVVWTPSRLIARLGKEINNESSYLYWAYKNNIPVFCPGITDGSLGDMLYFHCVHNPGLIVDVAQDNSAIIDEAVHASPMKTGMIVLGGGLPKHHICNANMLCNGADYAVFINTGQEFDGSDSGASPDEAISWGEISGGARNVKVHCDATIAFPLLVAETFASRKSEVLQKTN